MGADETLPRTGPTSAEERSSDRGSSGRRLVLLVEDSAADRDLYGSLLWYNGYEVAIATDGETAISRALELRPDLILLDLTLAGSLSGIDVARRLRGHGLDTPMIMVSAHSRREYGAAAAQAGAVEYLQKPVSPFVVVKRVMRQIGASRLDEGAPDTL